PASVRRMTATASPAARATTAAAESPRNPASSSTARTSSRSRCFGLFRRSLATSLRKLRMSDETVRSALTADVWARLRQPYPSEWAGGRPYGYAVVVWALHMLDDAIAAS